MNPTCLTDNEAHYQINKIREYDKQNPATIAVELVQRN